MRSWKQEQTESESAEATENNASLPELEVTIDSPSGSFLKRGSTGQVDCVSPFPCPFNYGSVETLIGMEGDLRDAVVLGPRLPRGSRVTVRASGAVGLTDRGMYDDKLICSHHPVGRWQRSLVLFFFHLLCKMQMAVEPRSWSKRP